MKRVVSGLLVGLFALAIAVGVMAPADADAKFGPKLQKCGKLKKAAKKKCLQGNAEMRMAFATVKDSRFTGMLFGGPEIDATFCASGKWVVEIHFGYETRTYDGSAWDIASVWVNKKQQMFYTEVIGPSDNVYTRVGLLRKKGSWYFTKTNPYLKAPPATKSSAVERCKTL